MYLIEIIGEIDGADLPQLSDNLIMQERDIFITLAGLLAMEPTLVNTLNFKIISSELMRIEE